LISPFFLASARGSRATTLKGASAAPRHRGGARHLTGAHTDTADPRFTTELLAGPLDPSNNAFGGGQWQPEYRAIEAGCTIPNVIGSAQIPDAQKNAVRGLVQMLQALAFVNVLVARTQDSIPIDVSRPVGRQLAPFVTNAVAYQHVVNRLDSARTSLAAANTFPFDPGPGFTGFNTPRDLPRLQSGADGPRARLRGEPHGVWRSVRSLLGLGIDRRVAVVPEPGRLH